MKIPRNLNIDPEILMKIDFDNSVNGGSSATDFRVNRVESGYEVRLRAPGIEADDMSVEVVNNRLIIYHLFPIYGQNDLLPDHYKSIRVIGNFLIPPDADFEKVTASYDTAARQLIVQLPFNEHQKGYRAKVTIQ